MLIKGGREMDKITVKSIKEDKTEKVLVCITSQLNSERLIDKAAELAEKIGAEFHILHVQQGDSIFNNSDTPNMINRLCQYGSAKGGYIHFYCDEDIALCIAKFIAQKHVSKVVMGQPPVKDINNIKELKNAADKVLHEIKSPVEVIVVPRDDKTEDKHIFINMKEDLKFVIA